LALADKVEELVDAETLRPEDRAAAYEAVKHWENNTAAYAYARASLAGRLAETKGLGAAPLIADMEKYARRSLALEPRFRNGAARRMLGTLYVLAPAQLVKHGDSEEGLSLLEKQVARHPGDIVNHLRLAEGYLALSDPDPAYPILCRVLERREELRPAEERLLATLIDSLGGKTELDCE
jgi:thioredoxin-like negative regulator of GroEL